MSESFLEIARSLLANTGFFNLSMGNVVMIVAGCTMCYLAIGHRQALRAL
jgi:Na+-transporting methylmalonyl-CoA/oxaloacetate decarboxylase beta subunit